MKGKTGPKNRSCTVTVKKRHRAYDKLSTYCAYSIYAPRRLPSATFLWKRGGLHAWSCQKSAVGLASLMTFDTPEENGKRDISTAALNARSREKTGLKAHEGDEDLVDYYYLVMNPNTRHGLDLRLSDGKRFRVEACPRLKERFPNSFRCVPCVSFDRLW